jgi:hypothetical protein
VEAFDVLSGGDPVRTFKSLSIVLSVALLVGAGLEPGAGAMGLASIPAPSTVSVDRQVWANLAAAPDRRTAFVVVMREAVEGDPASAMPAQVGLEGPLEVLQRVGSIDGRIINYGANAIEVRGTGSAVRFLAAWSGVARIVPHESEQPWEAEARAIRSPLSSQASGHITGLVTGPDSIAPLPGILVKAHRYNPVTHQWPVVGTSTTGPSGTYDVGGLETGAYRAGFSDPSGEYIPEYYNDQPDLLTATDFTVIDGQTTTDIDASLAVGGQIAGTVTRAEGGGAIDDIVVSAYYGSPGSWHLGGSSVTQPDGTYVIGGLAPGTHRVRFADPYTPPRYLDEYYDNVLTIDDATDVDVIAGATTADIDAALGGYGKISGAVTGPDGTTAISGIDVDVWKHNTVWMDWEWVSYGTTDSAGDYEANGLETADYRVEFSDFLGQFATEFYDDQTDLESGADVHVELGATTTGIDASLDLAAMSVDLPLVADWNLVSLSVSPDDPAPGVILSPIDGNYERIWAYDACDSSDPWKVYDPDIPASDLDALDEIRGHWLLATSPVTLTVNGVRPLETDVPLCVGWNLIGYAAGTSRDVTEVLAEIEGEYDLVFGYDAADLLDPWKKYDPAAPFGNDLDEMQPGFAYWIRMTQSATLAVQSR